MPERVPTRDGFWEGVEDELGRVPLQEEVQHDPFYSEPEWDAYRVRYDSLDGYRLSGWLSIPRGDGPFPGLIQMPDYGSAVDIPFMSLRHDAVVFNPSHRGQRGSDEPFLARHPGLLIEGIGDPHTHILRGVYADALRAVDLLADRSDVDRQRMVLYGGGLGATLALVAGALRPRVRALAVDMPIMVGTPGALELADAYPLEDVNDYLRTYPEEREAALASLEPFNPLALAGGVTCPVLLSAGARDRGFCPPPLGEELARQLTHGKLHLYPGGKEGGGHRHGILRTRWLREQLGLA